MNDAVDSERRLRQASLEALINSDPQRLRRRSISLGVHPADADDVAQTTALRAWRSVDTLRSVDDGQLCAWLDTIARNTVIDSRRSGKLILVTLDDTIADESDVVSEIEAKVALDEVLTQINALPDALRVPFLLSVFEKKSASDIAELLNLSSANVRQRITRARKAIAHLRPVASAG